MFQSVGGRQGRRIPRVGTKPNQLVQLRPDGKLPPLDGSLLTGLTAGSLVGENWYPSSQTITIPAGATKGEVWLFGGGGSTCQGNAIGGSVSSGAGGAGGTCIKLLTGLTAGLTLTLTLAAAPLSTTTVANGAGTSTLASGTQTIGTLTANGGAAGGPPIGCASQGSDGADGTASGGDQNLTGINPCNNSNVGGVQHIQAGIARACGVASSKTAVAAGTAGLCYIRWYS